MDNLNKISRETEDFDELLKIMHNNSWLFKTNTPEKKRHIKLMELIRKVKDSKNRESQNDLYDNELISLNLEIEKYNHIVVSEQNNENNL